MILPALSLDHLLNTDVLGGAWENPLSAFAVQPLFLAAILGFVAAVLVRTGSFKIASIHQLDQPLLFRLPLLFIVLGCALCIELRKVPFRLRRFLSCPSGDRQWGIYGVLRSLSGHH